MKKYDIKGNETEAYIQTNFFIEVSKKIKNNIKYKMIFAIPNGGSRNKIEAINLKLQGVKKGVPDVFVAVAEKGFNGMFIEFKKKGGRISPEQKEMIDNLNKFNYKAVVCYSTKEALEILEAYFD